MACPLFSISTFYLLSLIAAPVYSSGVTVSTQLDDQLPFIARVGQPYSWSISNKTFSECDKALAYSISDLPSWLSFDPATQNFHGTPSENDKGDVDITVTARGCDSTASSWFSLPVTSKQPPTLKTPVADQFKDSNPSLSSVFIIGPHSDLYTSRPAVRIPPKWSFSIGLQGDTYTAPDNVYYQVLQADGSEIPSWMRWNPQDITLEGVTPTEDSIPLPSSFNIVLHASDIKGATADTQSFDVIIANHEVSMTKAVLPTVNITADSPFSISLNSAADFSGLMVDGKPFQPEDLTDLLVETTGFPWISYDRKARRLSGDAPSKLEKTPVIPVQVQTTFNQSIQTNLSIALVPSFFTAETLSPILLGSDRRLDLVFKPFFSNSTSTMPNDVDLSTSYDPTQAGDVLKFDPNAAVLSGNIPGNFPSQRINVTITAYSHVTHSTSHSSIAISFSPSDLKKADIGTSDGGSGRKLSKKLVLGLSIAFGAVGGIIALGMFLACFRYCAKVEDTALVGEEGQRGWSEKDRKWYGIGEKSYDDAEKSVGIAATKAAPYGGLGLKRVEERSQSDSLSNSSSTGSDENIVQSPGVMSKKEFMYRIRDTVRNISDTYSRRRRPNLNRPVIGKPILINTMYNPDGLPPSPNPFDDPRTRTGPTVSFATETRSSTSSDDGSIPRRRIDGLPSRPAIVHFADGGGSRDSMMSHAAEAVVQTASRASVRSAMSVASDIHASMARPRLVPFTSASRVPIPNMSISSPPGSSDGGSFDASQRIVSQTALVDSVGKSNSGDELSFGIHYVRALGSDQAQQHVGTAASTLTVSTNVRSSFSSLESSHNGHERSGFEVVKMVVRAGERFKFRVPVEPLSPASDHVLRRLQSRLMSGNVLPKFLHADLTGRKNAGGVEFYGVPGPGDTGELDVGVFDAGVCVGRVHLEVISR